MESGRNPHGEEHRKHASTSPRLILLIAHEKLGVMTSLLLLCVINKRSYGMEGVESIRWLKGKLDKEGRGQQGTGTSLVQPAHCY